MSEGMFRELALKNWLSPRRPLAEVAAGMKE
jgi:hypothetical protein